VIDLATCMSALEGGGGLTAAMFTAGLIGGFGHCAPMCGPFVLAQSAAGSTARAGAAPVLARLSGGLLLPYHLGRMTTYSALGAAAGWLSGLVVAATGFRWLLAGALVVAAGMFLRQGLKGLARWLPVMGRIGGGEGGGGFMGNAAGWMARRLRPLLARPGGIGGFALGAALGFLPCGFLYAALASAVGSGGALAGAAGMAAFALGTMPSLLLVGLLGSAAGTFRGIVRAAAPALMLVNAGVLGLMAWSTLAR